MIKIIRTLYSDIGVLGILKIGDSDYRTLELPDKNNRRNISCIPIGTYYGQVRKSRKKGWCIQLQKVTNRTAIQLHAGNRLKDTQGCILVGTDYIRTEQEYILTESRRAIRSLINQTHRGVFKIIISNRKTDRNVKMD